MNNQVKKMLMIGAVIVPVLLMSSCGLEVVDAGETGIKKTMGKMDEKTYPPGMYFTNPFTTNIIKMNNQTQRFDGTTPVYTKDVQQANVSFVLNYNLRPEASVTIYEQVGIRWEERLIPQVVNGAMKNVIGKWNAIDLVANRQKASEEIQAQIFEGLTNQGINITNLELTNMDFAEQFEQAVEAKVVAVQRAEEAKNQTVQVEEQAKQKIISAEADAKAMQIKTEALKQSQSLVMYEAVQKWDGVLPVIVGGDGGNLLNIPEALLSK